MTFMRNVLLRGAGRIQKLLGKGGTNILSRVTGMILAALSVQVILEGIRELAARWGKGA